MKSVDDIEDLKKKLKELKPTLRKEFKVKSIGIFGSYIKGSRREESDLDILVEFEEDAELSLLDFIKIENYLSEILEVRADLVEKGTLKPRIDRNILKEVVNI